VTNNFLKSIMLVVILICMVGVLFWFISDKYPIYAAKKEVQGALKDVYNGIIRYGSTENQALTMEDLTAKEWVILSAETKQHWTFELVGDPPTMCVAQSTPTMPAGRDHLVKIDLATGKMVGWGTGIDDSLKVDKDAR